MSAKFLQLPSPGVGFPFTLVDCVLPLGRYSTDALHLMRCAATTGAAGVAIQPGGQLHCRR
ncbi:hypothetical protein ACFPVT_10305 [Corynebacterium choanae]|uniref:hypothetical protein n=1 Tax=Corynebacterium choanae TaxID=1862358 RepID=UPI000F4F4CFC|nr:hypothetical protein [Corynebacterium choanae]